MKNIIFLDIDGVFNCQLHYKSKQWLSYKAKDKVIGEQADIDYHCAQISKERVRWFSELCEQTDSKVVISSTWRMGCKQHELQKYFDTLGGTFEIIGLTGRYCRIRGVEIHKWIEDNLVDHFPGIYSFDFRNYAIIDDDDDMLLTQREHFFQTDGYAGLTPATCYKVKKFLTKKSFD